MNLHPKVAAGGVAGAATVLVVWLISLGLSAVHIMMPPEIASALTTVVSFAAGYYFPGPSNGG